MRIYIQVYLQGIVFGNGGYISLTALYTEFIKLGYEVYFFDPFCTIETPTKLIRVRPESEYLSCEDGLIVGLPFVLKDSGQKVIITNWVTERLYKVVAKYHWENSFVVLCGGQLLRNRYKNIEKLVRSLLEKSGLPLLIYNRYLRPLYEEYANMRQILYLDRFARGDFFYYDQDAKSPGVIGYQPEATPSKFSKKPTPNQIRLLKVTSQVTESLRKHVEKDKLVFCTGNHRDVAEKMRRCDIFFWYNTSDTNSDLFLGESFGLSIIEALACGCVVIVKENYFTRQIFPRELLCSSIGEGIQILNHLLSHPDDKDRLKEQCLEIAKDYRFDGFDGDRIRTINQVIQKIKGRG